MRRTPVAGIVLLCLFGPCPAAAQEDGASRNDSDGEMLEWLDDYQAALDQAQVSGRPIFLEFRCAP